MRNIAKNIRTLRVKQHMTQDTLAEKLYVTRQTVSNYETGKSRPDVETLFKIAEILNADINGILYEPEDTRLQRRRIAISAALAAVMALLWLVLSTLTDYVEAVRAETFTIGIATVITAALRFGYFFLLGYVFTGCIRLLLKARPLPSGLCKWIGWSVAGAISLIVLVLLPLPITPLIHQLGLQEFHFPMFWLKCVQFVMANMDIDLIFLFLGLILGLRSNWNQKL